MGKEKVINSQSFHDGKIVLYQLENRPRKKWLCRLKVPNGTGYVYRGTGTSDLYEARKFADNLYDELRLTIKLGESITSKDFKKLLIEFETNYPSEAPSEGRVISWRWRTRCCKIHHRTRRAPSFFASIFLIRPSASAPFLSCGTMRASFQMQSAKCTYSCFLSTMRAAIGFKETRSSCVGKAGHRIDQLSLFLQQAELIIIFRYPKSRYL